MESKRTAATYFIPPGKFLLMENALGNPDLIQSSVSSDCRVTIVDPANFPLDELEQWPTFRLTSADIKLKLGNGAYYIYIVVPTPENTESTLAFISYNTALVDRDGYQVLESTDEEGNPKLEKGELLGKIGFKYYQCGTVSARGGNSSAITTPSGQGRTLAIDLGVNPQDSHLDKKVDWDFFYSLFVPHYDDPDDPKKLTWIEAKSHMGIAGGLISFIDNGMLKLPSIYDGLPIDNQTLYWEETVGEEGEKIKILKSKAGEGALTLGGLLNVGEWADKIPVTDRILVQKAGSEMWEGMAIANIGTANFDNIKEEGEGNAYTSFRVSEVDGVETLFLKKEKTFVDSEYLKENFITKKNASELFVTLDETPQDIEGDKNFIGNLMVNGMPIVYDDRGFWKLEGDLLVTGGIASFSSDTKYTPSTIMDGIVCDEVTISAEGGYLHLVGESKGGISNVTPEGNGNAVTSLGLSSDGTNVIFYKGMTFAEKKYVDDNFSKKTYVDETFVTLKGDPQTIESQKNFIGGLQVNGNPIVYNSAEGYWMLDGDLIITGGLATFSSDMAYKPSSIMDAIVCDEKTITAEEVDGVKMLRVIGGGTGGGEGVDEEAVRELIESYKYLDTNAAKTLIEGYKYLDKVATINIYNSSGSSIMSYDGTTNRTLTLSKSHVGLANVENTALSTWTGNSYISKVGTITSGTWNGSSIGASYLPTATTSAKGVASFDSSYFSVSSGKVSFIGGGVQIVSSLPSSSQRTKNTLYVITG